MRIKAIYISTSYPLGYGSNDPRLITGTVEVQTGPNTYQYETVELSANALQKITDICLEDARAHQPEIPEVTLYFSKDDMPEPEPQPEADTMSDDNALVEEA